MVSNAANAEGALSERRSASDRHSTPRTRRLPVLGKGGTDCQREDKGARRATLMLLQIDNATSISLDIGNPRPISSAKRATNGRATAGTSAIDNPLARHRRTIPSGWRCDTYLNRYLNREDSPGRRSRLRRPEDAVVVPMAKIKIENVVASTSLGGELDLQAIALALGGAEYEPEQFPGLIYRLKEPKTATLLFRSGKVVCT